MRLIWWRRDLGREARWDLPIPGRRVVGLFFAFQEMRCWQKWWTSLGLIELEMVSLLELKFVV